MNICTSNFYAESCSQNFRFDLTKFSSRTLLNKIISSEAIFSCHKIRIYSINYQALLKSIQICFRFVLKCLFVLNWWLCKELFQLSPFNHFFVSYQIYNLCHFFCSFLLKFKIMYSCKWFFFLVYLFPKICEKFSELKIIWIKAYFGFHTLWESLRNSQSVRNLK